MIGAHERRRERERSTQIRLGSESRSRRTVASREPHNAASVREHARVARAQLAERILAWEQSENGTRRKRAAQDPLPVVTHQALLHWQRVDQFDGAQRAREIDCQHAADAWLDTNITADRRQE